MQLIDEFTIATAPDRAYAMLIDLARVAPCVPGAEIDAPDVDGVHPGRVSVKLGPMKFVYAGRVRIAEQDAASRTAVIEGEGRATGGADTAKVRSVMTVIAAGSGSRVRITTDLDIKGRAAQMGQGVITDVSRRLVSQAAGCIEARLAAGEGADDDLRAAPPVGGITLMASVVGSRVRELASGRAGRTGESVDPVDPTAEPADPTAEPAKGAEGAEGADDGPR